MTSGAPALEQGRINRYIARAGVCSRRNADGLIDRGLVKLNGVVVTEYWTQVAAGDVVEVNGRVVSPCLLRYILLNKPRNTITTVDDERNRRTVLDLVTLSEEDKAGVFPIGRLDRDTVGVLLLTNDGELAHRLMHPSYQIAKRYLARTEEPIQPSQIEKLRRGVVLEDGMARADMATLADPYNQHEIGLEIHEGRNRQVRRMLAAVGLTVLSLERVAYANLSTKGLARGRWRQLRPHEVEKLRKLVRLT